MSERTVTIEATKELEHAVRVAISYINDSLAKALEHEHPDRRDQRIYDWMDDRLHILRTLQLLMDKLEGEDNEQ